MWNWGTAPNTGFKALMEIDELQGINTNRFDWGTYGIDQRADPMVDSEYKQNCLGRFGDHAHFSFDDRLDY